MNGAKAFVEALKANDIRYVFGISGTHVLSAYDELKTAGIKTIQTTQEQSAGFMADAYGRVSRKPGVALVTAGPGALNIVNAVAQAYVESSPLVVFSGQCNMKGWGKGLYHELKHSDVQLNIFENITKWTARVSEAGEMSSIVSKALYQSISNRHRPVFVEIPENVFDEDAGNAKPIVETPKLISASRKNLDSFFSEIKNAKRPFILAGGGVLASGAREELVQFSKQFSIPIATTIMGKSACPTGFTLSLGIGSGILASNETKTRIAESDLVIAIGTRFDEVATGFFTLKLPKLIHIDIDSGEFNRNYPASLAIVADAKTFLIQAINLANELGISFPQNNEGKTKAPEEKQYETTAAIDPQYLLDQLFNKLKNEAAIIIGDAGYSSSWLLGCEAHPRHTILTPSGYNSMGFSIPGSIGAKLAAPESTVIALCGDGSFLMTGLELITAVKYGINVKCIVLHDEKYNLLTFFQDLKYHGRYTDTLIKTFDFAGFANNIGALGISIKSNNEIAPAIEKALEYEGPSLIDASINSKLIPPILKKLVAKQK